MIVVQFFEIHVFQKIIRQEKEQRSDEKKP